MWSPVSESFWAKKLGGQSAQQSVPGPQPHAPASSRAWWDQSAPVQAEPVQSVPAGAQVLYDAQGNAVMVAPNGQLMAQPPAELNPESIAHHSRSAHKAKSTDRCPKCGGPNYTTIGSVFTERGQVESKRCFDCGYPVDNRESGTPGRGGKVSGKTRQVEHGGVVNNFFAQGREAPAFAAEHGGPGR
jgi:hypothetical protein